MKKNLLEFSEGNPVILEEKSDGTVTLQVKWQHAGRVNENGRVYPLEILKREIDRIKPLMKERRIMGASFHPKGPANPDDISHVWENAWIEKTGACFGVLKIIPTERGRNVLEILKNGKLGLSSRGYGTTTRKTIEGREVEEVNADFKLATPGDFVLSPSVTDAVASLKEGVQRLEESLNQSIKEEVNMEKNKTQKIQRLWAEAKLGGYIGTFEQWRTKIYPLLEQMEEPKSVILKKIEEKALAKLKLNGDRERSLFKEARQAGYKKSFEQWKKDVLPLLEIKEESPEQKEKRKRAISYGRFLGLKDKELLEFVQSQIKKE